MSCDDKFHYGPTCSEKNVTTQIIRDLCNDDDKKKCSFKIDTDLFKVKNNYIDPCPDVAKQLKVLYNYYYY